MSKVRVESLDYLRGLMAFSVMIYHYCSWSGVELYSDSLLGKLGIYAVSMFYILSGLSLAIVYSGRVHTGNDVYRFWLKRLFRIVPLFWLVVTAVVFYNILLSVVNNVEIGISLYKLFLNYSLLFGFLEPDAYLSTGAWSIGNEMVFYAVLPLLLLLQNRFVYVIPVALVCTLAVGFYFSHVLFDRALSLERQWETYINPFNQFFLFLAGVCIGQAKRFVISNIAGWLGVSVFFLIFCFYPVAGDLIYIVSGVERFIFSALCIVVVFIVFNFNPVFKGTIHKSLIFMGECCYSIYLLHPLVAIPVVFVGTRLGVGLPVAYFIAVFLTLLCSRISFRYIETPSIELGKRYSKTPLVLNTR